MTWQKHPEWRGRKNYEPTEPLPESRQHYANVRIAEFQKRFGGDLDFGQLLQAFRMYGQLFDQGYRLRDGMEGAA